MDFSKQKRFVYEKAFSIKGVIQNLKTYQVATGDVQPSSLLSKDKGGGGTEEVSSSGNAKRERIRRRRRQYKERRKQQKRSRLEVKEDVYEIAEIKTSTVDRPEGVTSATNVPPCDGSGTTVSGSLSLLADQYSSSSSSSGDEPSSACDLPGAHGQNLSVPEVILGMYSNSPDSGGAACVESQGTRHLGFFEAVDSDDDDQEQVRGSALVEKVTPKASWDHSKAKWKFPITNLQSYVCANCGNAGHFTQDCTVATKPAQIHSSLKTLYSQAHKLGGGKDIHCVQCGITSNLVCCLECRSVYCDGRGHLSAHLNSCPTHTILYSCKLKKLVKCCKPTCRVVNVYDLLICGHCLSNAFSHHYSMITACWSAAGLRKVQNAVACEEHYHWHRVNCPSSAEESFISKSKLLNSTVSEFFF